MHAKPFRSLFPSRNPGWLPDSCAFIVQKEVPGRLEYITYAGLFIEPQVPSAVSARLPRDLPGKSLTVFRQTGGNGCMSRYYRYRVHMFYVLI